MTLATQPEVSLQPASTPWGDRWIPLFPTLWPSMLRRRSTQELPFPLAHRHRRDFRFARYGLYAIAKALQLEGREVLFPAFFHCVELDALLAAGARVVFFPVDRNLEVDPDEVARRIAARTAAIYLIHYAGFPAPVAELRDLSRRHGLFLIEDCAHALFSSNRNEPLGSFGDAAAFSLPKSLPTPDGGVAIMSAGWPNDDAERQAPSAAWVAAHTASLLLSNLEMRRVPGSRPARAVSLSVGKAAFSAVGHGYEPMGTPSLDLSQTSTRMSALSRRVLLGQDVDAIVGRRRRNYRYLLEQLDGTVEPIFRHLHDGICPLFFPLRVANREAVRRTLRADGITIGEFWPERHPMSPHQRFAALDELHGTLWLPCHQDLRPEALDWLIGSIRRAVRRA